MDFWKSSFGAEGLEKADNIFEKIDKIQRFTR